MQEEEKQAIQNRRPVFEAIKHLADEMSSFEQEWQQQKKTLKVNSKVTNQGTGTTDWLGRSQTGADGVVLE